MQARNQLGHPKLQFRRLHQFGKLLEVDGAIARIVDCLEQPLHFPGVPRLRDSIHLSRTLLMIKGPVNTKHPYSEFPVMPSKLPAMNTKKNELGLKFIVLRRGRTSTCVQVFATSPTALSCSSYICASFSFCLKANSSSELAVFMVC